MRYITNINKDWYFLKGETQIPNQLPTSWEKIDLPHTWNNIDGMDGGNDYWRGTSCYCKSLKKSELSLEERHFLEINGAAESADIYINGEKIFHHDGGFSTFRIDITDYLREENLISCLIDNSINEKVYPQTADFTFYGGLYRDVNIISVPSVHFDLEWHGSRGIMVTPSNEGKVCVETYIKGDLEDSELLFNVFDKDKNLVVSSREKEFYIKSPHLWNGIKDPYLYTLDASIVKDRIVLDKVSIPFGFRCFSIDSQRGFILNGEEYPLRGVARHQDRWGKGNAISKEDHEEDIAIIAEMGANTIRLAHYQNDQYFYDLCDQYGMIVWAEIPYISRHMSGADENVISQMTELVSQCYNHPSIVVWGLSNEITMDGQDDPEMINLHKRLNDMVHSMDKTRLTTIACLSTCSIDAEYVQIPDVVSYNHYFGWYGGDVSQNGPWFDNFHKKYPNIPIGCSEYGCEALNWHTSKPTQGDYTEEYQAYYHEELIKQLFSRKYLWATHVWNMFDFGADARSEGGENGQNHKGLVTIDRKYKKDAFYAYKAWLSNQPFVHITSKRYIERVEDVTKVTVYSNQKEVSLYVNGKLLETKEAPNHFFYFNVPNEGETKLEAISGAYSDSAIIRKVKEMNPDYVLRDQGAVLNWFDITEVEGRLSLNSKIGDITSTIKGKIWYLKLFLLIAKKMSEGNKGKEKKKTKKKKNTGMDEATKNMVNSFTVLRFTGMLGMRNVSFTKEELLKMNRELNKIKSK